MALENILPRVPGPCVAGALNTLPPAETAASDSMEVVIDVPGIGTVRFTAKRFRHKRGRVSHYFWTAQKAVAAD